MIKTKTALCIKKGQMSHGRVFAYKNKSYEYFHTSGQSYAYNVRTEGTNSPNHSMSKTFFEEYFLPQKKIELEEELFNI